MPTYQYACTVCGHQLEAVQSFSDAPLTTCPECDGHLRKVFSSVGIVFKGSGFYRTDSRTGSSNSEGTGSSDGAKSTEGAGSSDSAGSSDGSSASKPAPSSGTDSTKSSTPASGASGSSSGSSKSKKSTSPVAT